MADDTFNLAPVPAEAWTHEDTKAYLDDHPLPSDFVWNGKHPVPVHATLKGGYGKWLAETPNHRGLFPLIHRILGPLPSLPQPRTQTAATDALVALIRDALKAQGSQSTLFD